jgi:uncharacterized glyoxalase superfamily protein PhnB
MQFLKQSTASQSVLLGPFVDDTDGATAETALTIANTDIRLSKNGGNMAAKTSGGGTHDENGWYTITLDATDTNTVGRLQVSCKVAGALAVFMEFQVVEEAIYDALFGASAAGFDANGRVDVGSWLGTAVTTSATTAKPEVDVNSVSDDATAANNLELDYDGTGYAKANSTIGTCTTNTDMRGTDSAFLAASAPTNFSDLSITATTGLVDITQAAADKVWGTTTRVLTAGTNLNDISTAQVNTEVDNALVTYGLDHLVQTSVTGTDIANNSIIARLVSKSATADWDSYDNTTDSLEALRDRGDAAWITATGFSTHSAADVVNNWETQSQADPTGFHVNVMEINSNTTAAGQLALSADTIENGACEGTPSTTVIQTDLAETQDDIYIGRVVIFTSGNARGEATDITDYTGATGTLTVTALSNAPSAADTFILI